MMHWCWSMTFTEYHGWGCDKVSGAVVEQYLQAWRDLYLYCWGVFTSLRGAGCKRSFWLRAHCSLDKTRLQDWQLASVPRSLSGSQSSSAMFYLRRRLVTDRTECRAAGFGCVWGEENRKIRWGRLGHTCCNHCGSHYYWSRPCVSLVVRAKNWKSWLILKLWCEGQMFNLTFLWDYY